MSSEGDEPGPNPSALRRVLGELVRLDTSAVAPVAGLRVALGVVAALCLGIGLGNRGAAASMASGALLVGMAAVASGRRAPVAGLAAIALAMGITTFAGSATGRVGWLHTVVLVVACLAGGLLLALGQTATSVGTQGIAAMIVFGRFAQPPLGALHLAAYVVAGGALAVLAVALTRPPLTAKAQRRAVAAGYRGLAGIARTYRTAPPTGSAAAAFDSAESLLVRRLDPDPAGGQNLRALLDVGRRSRLELLAIDGLRRRLPAGPDQAGGGPRADIEAALGPAADALDAIADSLERGSPPGPALAAAGAASRAARDRISESYRPNTGVDGGATPPTPAGAHRVDAGPAGGPPGPATVEAQLAATAGTHLAALAGQVRAAADLAAGWSGASFDLRTMLSGTWPDARAGGRRPPIGQRAREAFDTLSDQATLRSPIGRHAVRLAVAVAIAETIALHTPLQRGYWVALTVSVVPRPDFSVTFTRGTARMAGTSLGVLLAGLLAVAVHPSGAAEIAVAGVVCAAACSTFQVSYLLYSALITGLVVLLVGFVSPGTVTTAVDRLLDTLIGGALALLAYTAWPTWSASTAHQAFAGLAEAQRDYLEEVLGAATGRRSIDPQRLRSRAKRARRARADAESAVDRSLAEPSARRLDVARSRGILAGLRRVSLMCHALRTDLEAGRLAGPFPAAADLADALGGAMSTVAAHLSAEPFGGEEAWHVRDHLPQLPSFGRSPIPTWRGGADDEDPEPLPVSSRHLRELHEQLVIDIAGEPGGAALVAETDELVDAIDTLGEGFGLFRAGGEQVADAL